MKNPFKDLLVPEFKDTPPQKEYKTVDVFFDSSEAIRITLAEPYMGKWALGYSLYFKDGRSACRLPSLEYGYFNSEREAILYFTGMITENANFFSSAAIDAVRKLMDEKLQDTLFS